MKPNRGGPAGMTLFEIIVVIFILSIVSVMMFRILVVNSRENQRLMSRIERAQALHAAFASLSRDIESAVPYPQGGTVLFEVVDGKEGDTDSDRVTLVLPARQADGSIALMERSYYLQRELRDKQVVWTLAWQQDLTPDGAVEQAGGHGLTPLSGMQTVSFDVKVSPPGENSWRDAWEGRSTLPEKIRVQLRVVDPDDADHPVEIAETVYLMAG